jgi:hypothetical protein
MGQFEVGCAQRVVQVNSHNVQQTCQEFDDEIEHSDHDALRFELNK